MRRVPKPSKRLMRRRARARGVGKLGRIRGVRRTRILDGTWGDSDEGVSKFVDGGVLICWDLEHADAEPRPQAKAAEAEPSATGPKGRRDAAASRKEAK